MNETAVTDYIVNWITSYVKNTNGKMELDDNSRIALVKRFDNIIKEKNIYYGVVQILIKNYLIIMIF